MATHGDRKVVSVVLGTLNRLPYLKAAIASVRRSEIDVPVEIIVVDGGSTDGTLAWLARQKDVITVIQHNIDVVGGKKVRKRSWGYFMNLGFKISQGELICMMSDDSVLHQDALANGLETYQKAIATGRRVGGVAFRWRSYGDEEKYRVGYTLGGKMFVNHGYYVRDALQAVGWLEEEALKFYFADGDVCLKMAKEGYDVVCGEKSFVEHFEVVKQTSKDSNDTKLQTEWSEYLKRWSKVFHVSDPEAAGYFDGRLEPDVSAKAQLLIPFCAHKDRVRANVLENIYLRRQQLGKLTKLVRNALRGS